MGLPVKTAMSASFPTSRLPTRSATPQIFAGLMVMAFKPSSMGSPALTAIPAQMGRDWISDTGWSVVIAVNIPAFCKIPTVLNATFCTSILLRLDKSGPTMAGKPSCASRSATRCPSLQWSSVMRRPNSLAIRTAVKISSTRCTCAFIGISPLNTASHGSIRKSSSKFLFSFFFFKYSLA